MSNWWDADIKEWADTLPVGGWRHAEGRDVWIEVAQQLIAAHIDVDTVVDLLGRLYAAAANEHSE